MKSRGQKAFTLVEVLLCAGIVAIMCPLFVVTLMTWKSAFVSSGFVAVGGESIPYSPSFSQQIVADVMMTSLREDDASSRIVIGVAAEVSPSYAGSSGVVPGVATAPPSQLADPALCFSLLSASGVPFTGNPGFTLFFLSDSGGINAIYSCSSFDIAGTRVYKVRRTTASNTQALAYSFAEPVDAAQTAPTLSLGVSAAWPAARFMAVRFPDPTSRFSEKARRLDSITNVGQRTSAISALRQSAPYVINLPYRR